MTIPIVVPGSRLVKQGNCAFDAYRRFYTRVLRELNLASEEAA